jgi:hypothetical protein
MTCNNNSLFIHGGFYNNSYLDDFYYLKLTKNSLFINHLNNFFYDIIFET